MGHHYIFKSPKWFYNVVLWKTAQTTNIGFFSRIQGAKNEEMQLQGPRIIHVSNNLAFRKEQEPKNCGQGAHQTLEPVQEQQMHFYWLYLGCRKISNRLWEPPGRRFLMSVSSEQSRQLQCCIFQAAVMTRGPSKMLAPLGEGEFSASQGNKGQISKHVAIMTKPGLRTQFIISLTLNTT